MTDSFKALVLDEVDDQLQVNFKQLQVDDLPEGDVLIEVAYSSLNYKDGLAVTGTGKVVRSFPMIPGIDLAGVVKESASPNFAAGDKVVLTGWGIGERYWGGYTQMARSKSEWLVKLPDALSLQQAMAIGTAGFTAMLCILALEEHGLSPDQGEVVVTGANGGVGGTAISVLGKLGYQVIASTGRPESLDYLKELGASDIIDRNELGTLSKRPMESSRWAGAVDTVGGDTLAQLLKTLNPGCSVAACGNAGGFKLPTTVFPFILRGVNLLGIDSVMCPLEKRQEAWQRLSQDLPLEKLDEMANVEPLSDISALSQQIIDGKIRGRTVIDVNS